MVDFDLPFSRFVFLSLCHRFIKFVFLLGHVLIITKLHYRCLGAAPRKVIEDFLAFKRRIETLLHTIYEARGVPVCCFWNYHDYFIDNCVERRF